jgi:stalled ribosome alternative rescue factor ArfA
MTKITALSRHQVEQIRYKEKSSTSRRNKVNQGQSFERKSKKEPPGTEQ